MSRVRLPHCCSCHRSFFSVLTELSASTVTDRIVRRMGGTLHYASTLGVGTTASMVLPLRLLGTDSDEDSSRSSSARQDDFFSDSPTAPPPRIISDELSQLLTPLQINSERFEGPPELKRAGSDESGVTTICRSPMKTEEEGVASPDSVSTVIEPPTPSVLRVLVSDDNPIARTILSRYLKAKVRSSCTHQIPLYPFADRLFPRCRKSTSWNVEMVLRLSSCSSRSSLRSYGLMVRFVRVCVQSSRVVD